VHALHGQSTCFVQIVAQITTTILVFRAACGHIMVTHRHTQVGKNQFVEKRVIEMWISMMLVGWFSATNCARSYDMALSQRQTDDILEGGWQFGMQLTTDHVWDAFVIFTLLKDHSKRNICLQVPHTGLQKDRFTAIMEEWNEHIIHFGQEEVPHFCNKCMRVVAQLDGTFSKCQLIVSDGLTLGHCCCGVFRCTTSLANNRHRFCPHHSSMYEICTVTGCERPVRPGAKSCDDADHQKLEELHFERGKAAFTLKERLQRQQVSNPDNAMADMANDADEELDDLEENDEWFEVDDGNVQIHSPLNPGSVGVVGDAICEATKSPTGNRKLKAQFGRHRTHNEETLVRPCGVIQARATFFGAEAVSCSLSRMPFPFLVPTNQNI